ncbi:hypothetical protein V8F33_002932 [Rhypophila sp. PSN 637]
MVSRHCRVLFATALSTRTVTYILPDVTGVINDDDAKEPRLNKCNVPPGEELFQFSYCYELGNICKEVKYVQLGIIILTRHRWFLNLSRRQ